MVSFRVSPDEYTHLRNACSVKGVRSVSELARTAMENLVLADGQVIPLDVQVQQLRDRVTALAEQIDRLSQRVPLDRTASASAS
jgi:hypothetical protein